MLNSIASSKTRRKIFEVADLLATITNRHYEDADSAHEAQMANSESRVQCFEVVPCVLPTMKKRSDTRRRDAANPASSEKAGRKVRPLRKQHNMRRCELAEMADLPEEQLLLY